MFAGMLAKDHQGQGSFFALQGEKRTLALVDSLNPLPKSADSYLRR
jgi:hypothetical protein